MFLTAQYAESTTFKLFAYVICVLTFMAAGVGWAAFRAYERASYQLVDEITQWGIPDDEEEPDDRTDQESVGH